VIRKVCYDMFCYTNELSTKDYTEKIDD